MAICLVYACARQIQQQGKAVEMMYCRRILFWLMAVLVLGPVSATAQEYRINPGDILRIEVIEDETLNRAVLVAPDGRITFPLAGAVRAAGRTVDAVQQLLVSRLSSNFAAPPSVYVALEQRAPRIESAPAEPETVDIYVLGEVTRPGKVALEPGSTTLLQAFAQMGGFTNFAATKRIQLRRKDANGVETIYALNYDAITRGATTNATLRLREGDVILVPTRRLFE